MSRDNGANPMRWDCSKRGCFNIMKRPKIEMLADCLPGRIAFTDIDGIAEVCGNLLLLEWKDHREIGTGQRLLFERMTLLCPATVLIVEGDAQDMSVRSVSTVSDGLVSPPEPADLGGLRSQIRQWRDWALANSALRNGQGATCS